MELPNNHYKDCAVEPIKVIKAMLTHEQFLGFLLGNVFKYRMRAGHKTEGDIEKALQYEDWYKEEKDVAPQKVLKNVTIRALAQTYGEDLSHVCAAAFVRKYFKPEIDFCERSGMTCIGIECPYLDLSVEQLVHKLGTSGN